MKKREIRVIEGVECLQCSKCKEWKEFNGFDKYGEYKDGTQKYFSHCKECRKEYQNKRNRAKGVKEKKRREVKIIDGVKYLQCTECKEFKDVEEFGKGGKCKDGTQKYEGHCKECRKEYHKEYHKEYRKTNSERMKEYDKEYHKKRHKILTQESLDHTKKIFLQNGLINDKLKDKGLYGIIYLFQNKINKRCYVGQTTVGLENRYSRDVIEGWIEDRKTHESVLLEEDIKKYGTEVFTCDIIDVGYCKFHLDKLEAYYIDKYKAFEEGYNNNRGNLTTSDGIQEFKELIKEYGLEELVSKEAIEFFEKNLEEEIVC